MNPSSHKLFLAFFGTMHFTTEFLRTPFEYFYEWKYSFAWMNHHNVPFKSSSNGLYFPNTPLYRSWMSRKRMLLCSPLCGSSLGNSIELGSACEMRLISKITSFMGTWGVSQEISQNKKKKVRSKTKQFLKAERKGEERRNVGFSNNSHIHWNCFLYY